MRLGFVDRRLKRAFLVLDLLIEDMLSLLPVLRMLIQILEDIPLSNPDPRLLDDDLLGPKGDYDGFNLEEGATCC